jgi:hypothetical protein
VVLRDIYLGERLEGRRLRRHRRCRLDSSTSRVYQRIQMEFATARHPPPEREATVRVPVMDTGGIVPSSLEWDVGKRGGWSLPFLHRTAPALDEWMG